MKKNNNTTIDCLTISKELLAANIDSDTKLILAYIQFRANLKHWTISNANMSQELSISRKTISRNINILVTSQVLIYKGKQGRIKLYTINSDKIKEFIFNSRICAKRDIDIVQTGHIYSPNEPYICAKRDIDIVQTGHYNNNIQEESIQEESIKEEYIQEESIKEEYTISKISPDTDTSPRNKIDSNLIDRCNQFRDKYSRYWVGTERGSLLSTTEYPNIPELVQELIRLPELNQDYIELGKKIKQYSTYYNDSDREYFMNYVKLNNLQLK